MKFETGARPVGAGLLAKAVCQSTFVLNDALPSRASPLPQGLRGYAVTKRRSNKSSN
ncbi:hypothetical protein PS918_00032 [Pseudomonas fluorescens]|uniref:Uncharacterized protein n=1 Tax=Pseudomonas fluorescens TaxID=294 RepID=A0A5E7QUF6_PSEFL|nr:hypothetical protein PS918_00032 [Pseudomonas fluorescens]